jgi:hypothetical protein
MSAIKAFLLVSQCHVSKYAVNFKMRSLETILAMTTLQSSCNTREANNYLQCSCVYVYVATLSFCVASPYVVSVLLFCSGLMLLGHFSCHYLAVNHGFSTLFLHQRRGIFGDTGFVIWRCIRDHNLLKTFSKRQEQCLAAVECLWMNWNSKKWIPHCEPESKRLTMEWKKIHIA